MSFILNAHSSGCSKQHLCGYICRSPCHSGGFGIRLRCYGRCYMSLEVVICHFWLIAKLQEEGSYLVWARTRQEIWEEGGAELWEHESDALQMMAKSNFSLRQRWTTPYPSADICSPKWCKTNAKGLTGPAPTTRTRGWPCGEWDKLTTVQVRPASSVVVVGNQRIRIMLWPVTNWYSWKAWWQLNLIHIKQIILPALPLWHQIPLINVISIVLLSGVSRGPV